MRLSTLPLLLCIYADILLRINIDSLQDTVAAHGIHHRRLIRIHDRHTQSGLHRHRKKALVQQNTGWKAKGNIGYTQHRMYTELLANRC